MSATIVSTGGTKRLQLSNGQALRRPVYLDNWTTMRIGLRMCVPSGATIVGTPRLWVGIGSGLTNGIGDATTTNWIGVYTNTATWTRSTLVTPAIGYTQNIGFRMVKRIGSTTTQHATGDMAGNMVVSMSDTFFAAFLVEITKGSPNYSINVGYPATNSAFNGVALPGVTEAMMNAYMSLPIGHGGIGAVSNPNYTAVSTNGTLAMSEVAGVLDCIQIYWDKTAAPLEIDSLWHRKLA